MEMWVPLKEKEKKTKQNIKITWRRTDGREQVQRQEFFFLVFIIFSSFSDSRKFDRRNSSG